MTHQKGLVTPDYPHRVYPYGNMSEAVDRSVEESFGTPTRMGAPANQSPLPSLSVVVPVFNSAQTLEPLVDRLSTVLSTCSSRHEIILVDDGSKDASWDVIANVAKSRTDCRGIGLTRNYGQHNAVLAGARSARYEVIVTIDDDLQNPPEEIPTLLAALIQTLMWFMEHLGVRVTAFREGSRHGLRSRSSRV